MVSDFFAILSVKNKGTQVYKILRNDCCPFCDYFLSLYQEAVLTLHLVLEFFVCMTAVLEQMDSGVSLLGSVQHRTLPGGLSSLCLVACT